MIKQTVSYGVWTLNRHDDNKIEVLKNGQVCEKASPAYREIAAEIGFEIDPEWRTSQLGRNVFKAVENAANSSCSSTTASTPVEEKKTSATEQEPAPKKTISEDKNTQPIQEVSQNETISVFDVILQSEGENKLQVVKAVKEQLGIGLKEAKELVDAAPSTVVEGVDKSTAEKLKLELESVGAEVKICSKTQAPTTNASQKKYDVNSIENSEDYYRNDPMLRAFYKENRNYTKEQFDALLSKAVAGDAIAQYQCGYIFAALSRIQYTIEGWGECSFDNGTLERYSKITDVSQATTLATEWLAKSAEQGFGLAMQELGEHYLHGPLCDFVRAVRWKDRCKEVSPWRSNFDLYVNFNQQGSRAANYPKLLREKNINSNLAGEWLGKKLELQRLLETNEEENNELKKTYKELEQRYNELEKRYKELEKTCQNLRDKHSTLEQKYSDLRDKEERTQEKYNQLRWCLILKKVDTLLTL